MHNIKKSNSSKKQSITKVGAGLPKQPKKLPIWFLKQEMAKWDNSQSNGGLTVCK